MSNPFIAQITIFSGNFAPRGFAYCDGQLLAISSNEALFSLVGTIYGGDGRTTFGLPDLRGRAAIGPRNGPGLSSYREGQRGGVETVYLNATQIPSHNHTGSGTMSTGPDTDLTDDSNGNLLAHQARNGNDALDIYTTSAATNTMKPNSIAVTTNNTGGNQDHENRQPWLAINYIIALQGTFPSRN